MIAGDISSHRKFLERRNINPNNDFLSGIVIPNGKNLLELDFEEGEIDDFLKICIHGKLIAAFFVGQ